MRFSSLLFSIAISSVVIGSLLVAGCQDHRIPALTYPLYAEAANPAVLAVSPNGTTIYNGGFGSALAPDPTDPAVFYLLTDRGPNAAGSAANSIIFGKADFDPQIGRFRVVGNQLVLERTILLKNAAGQLLTGLPNPVGQGNTGETALDLNGQIIAPNIDGLDSEGLVLASDGTFWISDEYGPHIVHFDATGKLLNALTHLVREPAGVRYRKCWPGVGLTGVWKG